MPRPFDVPDVDPRIKDGAYYMVAEITFEVAVGRDRHVWRALVELETNSILYLRPLSAYVNGYVYEEDPITKTGTTTPTSASNNATLNPHRDDVVLENLDAPVWRHAVPVRHLRRGDPSRGPEHRATDGTDGHRFRLRRAHEQLRLGQRLLPRRPDLPHDAGPRLQRRRPTCRIPCSPIPVDIRCFDVINAHCVGDGMGGIGHAGYGAHGHHRSPANPLGRACDPRVHLHEVLGHGILYEAVDSPNMGFTHSAGDSLSLIYFDPDSQLQGRRRHAAGQARRPAFHLCALAPVPQPALRPERGRRLGVERVPRRRRTTGPRRSSRPRCSTSTARSAAITRTSDGGSLPRAWRCT